MPSALPLPALAAGGFEVRAHRSKVLTLVNGTASSFPRGLRLLVLAALLCLGGVTKAQNFYAVSNTNDSGAGSLRQAILSANTAPPPASPHTISLAALADGAVIELQTALPSVEAPILFLGSSSRTITLRATATERGNFNGLGFTAESAGSKVLFLSFTGFLYGIVGTADNLEIAGNTFIDCKNTGVRLNNALNALIGGDVPAEFNVFAQNGWNPSNSVARGGVEISCTELDVADECAVDLQTTVMGNHIGVERDGVTAAGNAGFGVVLVTARGVTLGGTAAASRNTIANNRFSGVMIRERSRDITLRSNAITGNGVQADSSLCDGVFWAHHCGGITILDSGSVHALRIAAAPMLISDNTYDGVLIRGGFGANQFEGAVIGALFDSNGVQLIAGNGGDGVRIQNSPDNQIGQELDQDSMNVIAANAGAGVRVTGSLASRNAVHPNSIFLNLGSGVVLETNANGGIARPTITSLAPVSGTVLGSDAGVVEIHVDDFDQGETHLATVDIVGTGFSAALDLSAYAGKRVTALQTRNRASSAFSAPVLIPAAPGSFVLSVTVAGNGSVASTPPGIGCPGDCTQSYPAGTQVSLAATAGSDFVFQGWTGACTGSGACQVSMNAARSVGAAFVAAPSGAAIFHDGFEGAP